MQYVIALDKKTGRTKWQRGRSPDLAKLVPDLRKAYSTPIVVEVSGRPQLISSGAGATLAYDPVTGEELWKVRYGRGFSMSSRPVAGAGLVFLNTGFMQAQLLAVRPLAAARGAVEGNGETRGESAGGGSELPEASIVWRYKRSVPKMSSPLFVITNCNGC